MRRLAASQEVLLGPWASWSEWPTAASPSPGISAWDRRGAGRVGDLRVDLRMLKGLVCFLF